ILGIDTADGGVREPLVVRNSLPSYRLPCHALDQRGLSFHPIRILLFETHGFARALSACLLAGSPGPANNGALAKDFERVHQHAAKSGAIADKECDCHDSPSNA